MKIQEDWNRMAAAYEEFNTGEDSYSRQIEWPCIQKLLPELRGRTVLDVGCGTGIFTFLLEDCGPQTLVGLDLSERMLDIARRKAARRCSRAEFVQGDAARISEAVHQSFDFIFSSTTTHYLSDLEAFFRGAASGLNPGGCAILSMIHPVYSAQYPIQHGTDFPTDEEWQVRYLDRSRRAYIQPWIEYNDTCENHLSVSYHYTVGDYLNAALRSGLTLCAVEEPAPPERWKSECPGRYESFVETPAYLILKFVK